MEKDILALIAKESAGFSKGKRNIAKYILENYDKAAFMTAGKLGKTVGVSESTVVRFAAELGYDGYPGMRKALQEIIRNRLTSVQRIDASNELMDSTDLLQSVLRSDIERMQTTLNEVNQAAFEAAVDAILKAGHVYIAGARSSTCLATFMGFYMNLLRENVHMIHDNSVSEVYEEIFRVSAGDVFVGISYPRYSSRTVKAMEFAKSTGATVIAITDAETSPLVDIADICLFAKSDMVTFLDSLVAPLSLINALVASVGIHSKENMYDTFRKLESIWSRYEVYEKIEGTNG